MNSQLAKQRNNLIHVCRFSLKSLVDKACYEVIDEDCEEVHNLLAILEHVFSHRLKASSWIGSPETRRFWDFIRMACKLVPHNCLASVEALECPRTSLGKGRAWIQMCLMEKRLAEYMSEALRQTRMLRNFYLDGALMLSDDANMLAGLIVGLNVLDFSFDVRMGNLDNSALPIIDFTPYLKFDQINHEHLSHDNGPEIREITGENLNAEFWRTKCLKTEEQYRVLLEQKGYMEELARLREGLLDEANLQRAVLMQELKECRAERKLERAQLEGVILELQAQMGRLEADNWSLSQRVNALNKRHPTQIPIISMSTLASRLQEDDQYMGGRADVYGQANRLGQSSPRHQGVQVSSTTPTLNPQQCLDTHSLLSIGSTQSATAKDDNQSMVALAGSYTSLASLKTANEGTEKLKDAELPPQDPISADDNREKEKEQGLTKGSDEEVKENELIETKESTKSHSVKVCGQTDNKNQSEHKDE